MPKISQIDEVPCQAEVRILQKINLNKGNAHGTQRERTKPERKNLGR